MKWLLLLLPALAACGSATTVDVKDRDSDADFLRLRVAFPNSSAAKWPAWILADIGRATGEGTLSLAAGESFDLGGPVLPGPAEVDTACRLTWVGADVLLRFPPERDSPWRGDFGLGFEASRLEVELASPVGNDSDARTFWSVRTHLRVGWRPVPWAGPYAELGGSWGLGPALSRLGKSRVEAGIELRPWPADPEATLFAGWSRIHLVEDLEGSDVNYELRGWLFGLDLGF